MHICICKCIYIPKCNPSVYMILSVRVFWADDHLAFENQVVCSFLEKTTSPSPNFPLLPMVLYVGLRPNGLFPIYFGMFIGVIVVQLMFRH